MISAVDGGIWLRMGRTSTAGFGGGGGGAAGAGGFLAAHPISSTVENIQSFFIATMFTREDQEFRPLDE